MSKAERSLAFPAGSPCLDGHFPGNPVVPAAAILAALIDWSEKELGRRVTGVANARFQKPLLPAMTWRVALEEGAPGEATLIAHDDEGVAMRARLTTETR